MTKGFLNREALLQKEELEIIQVFLDADKKEFVYVRQMTGSERDKFEKSLYKKTGKGLKAEYDQDYDDFRAKLSVSVVCDEGGTLVFKPTDFKMLSQNMSAYRLEKIVNTAQKINNISDEDKEEMIKN